MENARHLLWRLNEAEQLRKEGRFYEALKVLVQMPDDEHDCHASEDDGCSHPSHGEDVTN